MLFQRTVSNPRRATVSSISTQPIANVARIVLGIITIDYRTMSSGKVKAKATSLRKATVKARKEEKEEKVAKETKVKEKVAKETKAKVKEAIIHDPRVVIAIEPGPAKSIAMRMVSQLVGNLHQVNPVLDCARTLKQANVKLGIIADFGIPVLAEHTSRASASWGTNACSCTPMALL